MPAFAFAGELQDPAQVRQSIERFVIEQTRDLPGAVELARTDIDTRLRLARCSDLESFLPAGARLWGNSTVGVRCSTPEKWSIFVPVQVRVWGDVVVAARPLSRGQTLSAAELTAQRLDLAQLSPGVLTDVQQAAGRVLSASIPGGTPIRADMLRAVPVVLQGQTVRVVFAGQGFHVSSEGKALGNAGVGEAVQIRAASGKLLKGIVREAGIVEVR
jgi:flagella basal body P-ring formation protein FlgA